MTRLKIAGWGRILGRPTKRERRNQAEAIAYAEKLMQIVEESEKR